MMLAYKISCVQKSGRFKQCFEKASREECGCTDDMKMSSMQRDTDCRERVSTKKLLQNLGRGYLYLQLDIVLAFQDQTNIEYGYVNLI